MSLFSSLKTLKRSSTSSWAPNALRIFGLVGLLTLIGVSNGGPVGAAAKHVQKRKISTIRFDMVRSAAAENGMCLANASADVRVISLGPVELMSVDVKGLPPNTEFDFFVLQLPNAPFGLAWYQGDIETNEYGE